MSQLHTSACFSFTSTFEDSEPFHLFYSPKDWKTELFECSNGLSPGDFASYYDSPLNIVPIQPSMSLAFLGFLLGFRPSETTLKKIYDLYEYNGKCALSERRHFEKEDIISEEYTLIVDLEYCTSPIYTRHPTSLEITKHEHPYSTLPPLSLPAHPVFVASHGFFTRNLIDISDIIVKIGLLSSKYFNKKFRVPSVVVTYTTESPPNTCPKLTRSYTSSSQSSDPESSETSLKRKRVEDVPEPAIANWLDEVVSARFDEIPTDDVGIYASEPSKSYDAAIRDEQDWIGVAENSRTKKRPRREVDVTPHRDIALSS